MDDKLSQSERFSSAVKVILKHEGRFTDDVADPGGATDYGISLRFLKNIDLDINADGEIDIDDIKDLTVEKATEIYKQYWWDKYNYNAINSLPIATKIFDMAVNMGAHEAHELVQRALGYCGYSNLVVDGDIGVHTLAAINEVCLHGRESDLMEEIINESKWFYEYLVDEKPTLKVFLKGWLKRAEW